MSNKKTISDAQLKNEIIKLFESGQTGKTDLLGLLNTEFKLGRDRYFKLYDIAYLDWSKIKDKATSEQVATNAKEGLISALRTKDERLQELQNDIDLLAEKINTNKDLTPAELSSLVKAKKDIHAEISKMQGDYAPSKKDVTHKNPIDFSNAKITFR